MPEPETSARRRTIRPSTLVITIAVSLALSLPAILSGFVMDDLVFTSPMYEPPAPFGYYGYIDEMRRLDILPWWASEDLKINFFRVLGSASLYVDFHLGHKAPLFSHIHTAIWFVALLLGAARLFGGMLENPRHRKWAFILFALGSYHSFLAGFIAARHALMGGAFAVWASALYLDWHRTRERRYFVLTMALFFFGLLSGETALAFAGFALSHDLFFVKGNLRQRLSVFFPVGLAAAAYLVFYKTMGFGPTGSGMYLNPLTDPVGYILAAPGKVLSMVGAFTLGMPAHLRMAEGLEAAPLVTGGIGLLLAVPLVLLAWKHLQESERRLIRWALVMGLLTMAPGLSGITSGRAVSLSGIAFSLIMALTLTAIRFGDLSRRKKWIAWPLALVVAFGLLFISPLFRLGQSLAMIHWGSTLTTKLAEKTRLPCDDGAAVYVINGDFLTAYYAPFLVAKTPNRFHGDWHELVATNSDITVRRDGENRIFIAHEGNSLLGPMSFALFADPRTALPQGSVFKKEGLTVTVEKRSAKGPTELAFHIPHLTNPKKVCLLTLSNYELHPFALPAPGRTVKVPYQQPTP